MYVWWKEMLAGSAPKRKCFTCYSGYSKDIFRWVSVWKKEYTLTMLSLCVCVFVCMWIRTVQPWVWNSYIQTFPEHCDPHFCQSYLSNIFFCTSFAPSFFTSWLLQSPNPLVFSHRFLWQWKLASFVVNTLFLYLRMVEDPFNCVPPPTLIPKYILVSPLNMLLFIRFKTDSPFHQVVTPSSLCCYLTISQLKTTWKLTVTSLAWSFLNNISILLSNEYDFFFKSMLEWWRWSPL